MSISTLLSPNDITIYADQYYESKDFNIVINNISIYNASNVYASGVTLRAYRQGKIVTVTMIADHIDLTIGTVTSLYIANFDSKSISQLPEPATPTNVTVLGRINGVDELVTLKFVEPSIPNKVITIARKSGNWESTANGGVYAFTFSYIAAD
jgi:hypothetical protein